MAGQTAHRDGPIGVIGLWHLGSVTAACLADAGCEVIGVDPDPESVAGLRACRAPVSEPGLDELLARNAQRMSFACEPHALADARCAWVTFDTPVDDDDNADVEWVLARAVELLAPLPADSLAIVSSQLPAGSVARLRERCAARRGHDDLRFACVPENLRLGRALECFRARDERIVAGVRSERDRNELAELLAPFGARVEWMRVESAEMSKHALNGFLATSVAFINEIAEICESLGADAEEVSRALKSEPRIGPHAYLAPGDAFAGGTLARDVGFLCGLAEHRGLPAHVFAGVLAGNDAHRQWTRRKLLELLGGDDRGRRALAGRRVAIWGLTYKPGTDTLRRSSAIELCRWLAESGSEVRAHDPAVTALPVDLAGAIELCASPLEALAGAQALVVCTAWPDYLQVPVEELVSGLATPARVIDPGGALRELLAARADVHYVRVGSAPASPLGRRPQARPGGRSAAAPREGTPA